MTMLQRNRSWVDFVWAAVTIMAAVSWWAANSGVAAWELRAAALEAAAASGAPVAQPSNGTSVTGFYPTGGPLTGGTTVTITGTNLTGASLVTFGGTAATIVGTPTATQVTVTTPSRSSAGFVDVLVTASGATSTTSNASKFLYDDTTITYVLPSWESHNSGTTGNYTAMATAIRARILDGPKAKLGLSLFVDLPMDSYTVDTTSQAAIRTLLAGTESQLDQAILRAKTMNPPMPIGLSLLTRIRDRVDAVQTTAEAEDRRNVQWYGDHASATGWVTFSQYARKLRRFQEAYLREVGTMIRQKMIENPTVPIVVTGDGEVEMTFSRCLAFSSCQIGDYSPFAIAEFKDWLRATGAYATGQPLAGQAYSNASRYTTDTDPGTDSSGDGHTFNGDFGTSFTTWNLEFFGGDPWGPSGSTGETVGAVPTGATSCPSGYSAASNSTTPIVCALPSAVGFDAPRTIPITAGQLTTGDTFWQAWIRFRQEMVWRYNKDFAKWLTQGTGALGGVPGTRFFSAQVPADKLFTNSLGLPNDGGLRLLTGASPHWVADVRPYGGAGVTGYNANTGGCSTTTAPCQGSQALGANGPFFRTTDVVAPLVEAFGRWGIVEWNPADPFSNTIDIYRDDVLTVRRYRPALLMPFKIPSDHWKVFDPDSSTPLPFEQALQELMQGRTGNSSHPGIATAGGWLPRVTWAAPARLLSGSAVGATRLNATANVAGNFTYYSDSALTTTITASTVLTVSGTTSATRTLYTRFTPTDSDYGTATASVQLTVDPLPAMTVNPTAERLFSGVRQADGTINSMTGAQVISVSFSNPNNGPWSTNATAPWVTISNGSGTGAGLFSIGINTATLKNTIGNTATVATAAVTVTATSVTSATASQTIPIRVTIGQPAEDAVPIGQVDTPAQGQGTIQGSIGITGWVVDDRAINAVKIYRNCLPFEAAASPSPCVPIVDAARGNVTRQLVFVGDANFVSGARPDIESLFPALPATQTAGWGFLVLTPMLPNVTAGLPNGGEGSITFYVFALDQDSQRFSMLGRSFVPANAGYNDATTISMVNVSQSLVKPFGAIDTPAQGATVSGTVNNFGWALTPDSNTLGGESGDISISPNGASTVFLNAAPAYTANPLGQITFNYCRGNVGLTPSAGVFCNDDVSNIFGNVTPQAQLTTRTSNPTLYRNLDAGRGPIGLFSFNSAAYANGVYQLQWAVYDNIGRVEGIGSRFITVLNSGGDPLTAGRQNPEAREAQLFDLRNAQARVLGDAVALRGLSRRTEGVRGRAGFNLLSPYSTLAADDDGVFRASVELQDRIEIDLGGPVDAGYLVTNGTLRALPAGSTLREGTFHWGGVPGYLGDYDLVFVRGGERIDLTVTVEPETPDLLEGAAVHMHADEARVIGAAAGGRTVEVGGWAYDPRSGVGAGIGAVHVWARRIDVGGIQTPFFLGEATIDGRRPDVAAAFPGAPQTSGFGLHATLAPGTYEITSYVWVNRTGRFEDARTVTITVR